MSMHVPVKGFHSKQKDISILLKDHVPKAIFNLFINEPFYIKQCFYMELKLNIDYFQDCLVP